MQHLGSQYPRAAQLLTKELEDFRSSNLADSVILLGAETLRGLYPIETISIVGKIYSEAEKVYNQAAYFKKTVKYVGEPMIHLESIASSAARQCLAVRGVFFLC